MQGTSDSQSRIHITWEAGYSVDSGSGCQEQPQDFAFLINPPHDASAAGLWRIILVAKLLAK